MNTIYRRISAFRKPRKRARSTRKWGKMKTSLKKCECPCVPSVPSRSFSFFCFAVQRQHLSAFFFTRMSQSTDLCFDHYQVRCWHMRSERDPNELCFIKMCPLEYFSNANGMLHDITRKRAAYGLLSKFWVRNEIVCVTPFQIHDECEWVFSTKWTHWHLHV